MGKWMVGVMSCQKIYCLNSVKCQKVEKMSGWVGLGLSEFEWVWWVWWVSVGDESVVGGSVNSGCHELLENIWFE